jgi:hypothetical protein
MVKPRSLGYHAVSGREVFLFALGSATTPYTSIAGSHSTCFCADGFESSATARAPKALFEPPPIRVRLSVYMGSRL